MNPGETEIFALVAGALFVQTIGTLSARIRKIRRRGVQLRLAAELLEHHYAALEKFLSDPASPAHLRDFLLWLSDTSSDSGAAKKLIAHVATAIDSGRVPEPDANFSRSLADLRAHRPDLVDAFEEALSNGLMATFLRWERTAEIFNDLAPRLTANPKAEMAVAAKAASDDALWKGRQGHPGRMAHA